MANKCRTWEELAQKIANMSDKQRKSNITIRDRTSDEFYMGVTLDFSGPENDVLDCNHPYLVIDT